MHAQDEDDYVVEFDFELKRGFQYAHNGDLQTAKFIKFLAPTAKHARFCAGLKQAIFRSLPTATEGRGSREQKQTAADDEDSVLEGDTVMTLVYASQTVELSHVLSLATGLFTSSPAVALVDGEEKLTRPLLELINPDEFEQIIGDYIARFIVASVWSRLQKS